MITRAGLTRFPQESYNAELPPPLCFTAPSPAAPAAGMIRSGAPTLNLGEKRLMADPSDPTTWQRPYRFTE